MKPTSGINMIRVAGQLDRERVSAYNLSLEAKVSFPLLDKMDQGRDSSCQEDKMTPGSKQVPRNELLFLLLSSTPLWYMMFEK